MTETKTDQPGSCPTCSSPDPLIHPAMICDGVPQHCEDPFHSPDYTTPEMLIAMRANARDIGTLWAKQAMPQLVDRIREQDKRLFELREINSDYANECKDLRRERNAVATVDIHGTWIWGDTYPNHIESMGAEMVVTMTAGRLRALMADGEPIDYALTPKAKGKWPQWPSA